MSAPVNCIHTPGPWSAIAWTGHAKTTVIAAVKGERVVVAECSGHGRYAAESEPDARLIAAAPDMLAALRIAEREMSALRAAVGAGLLTDKAIDLARAAIAKAVEA